MPNLRERIKEQLWAEAPEDYTDEDIEKLIETMTVGRFLQMIEYMEEEIAK